MTYSHLKLRLRSFPFPNLRLRKAKNQRYTHIACPVVDEQSQFCCCQQNWLGTLWWVRSHYTSLLSSGGCAVPVCSFYYNASLLDPCIIVSNKLEDYLFLRASSFLYGASSDSLIPLSGAFHCSLRRCYVCLWGICLPGGRILLPFTTI